MALAQTALETAGVAAAPSLASLALPLLARYDDFAETARALEAILFGATPGAGSFAGSADVFDFETCHYLYPLVAENRFYFPETKSFAALVQALFPTADPVLAPSGFIAPGHFIYTPHLGPKRGTADHDVFDLQHYLQGGLASKNSSEATAQSPTVAQIKAWGELKEKGHRLIDELSASSHYQSLALRGAAKSGPGGSIWRGSVFSGVCLEKRHGNHTHAP